MVVVSLLLQYLLFIILSAARSPPTLALEMTSHPSPPMYDEVRHDLAPFDRSAFFPHPSCLLACLLTHESGLVTCSGKDANVLAL